MLQKLRNIFISLFLIVFIIPKYVSNSTSKNFVSSTPPLTSNQVTSPALKIRIVRNESLHHTSLASIVPNSDEIDKGERNNRGRRTRERTKVWDQWGKWSGCSVTCGIGKLTRWRHCIAGSCSAGEKKAQLKTCTLASC